MADFVSDLSTSLGISSTYTVLGNGWVRERTNYGLRDSYEPPSVTDRRYLALGS